MQRGPSSLVVHARSLCPPSTQLVYCVSRMAYNAVMSLPLTASVEETPTAAAGSTQPRKTPADVTDRGFTVLWEGQDPIAE